MGKGKTNQTERACLNMPQYQSDLSHVCGIERLFWKVGLGLGTSEGTQPTTHHLKVTFCLHPSLFVCVCVCADLLNRYDVKGEAAACWTS